MSELWVKVKPWAVGIACGWVLLAFIFIMQRYGSHLISSETLLILWNKAGDFILLKWFNSTIATGLMAIIAALLGGYFLFVNSNAQHHREKISYVKLMTMHTTTITHELNNNLVIDEMFLKKLINSAEKLSYVDETLMWLSLCTAKHLKFYLEDNTNTQKKKYSLTMLVCLSMSLLDAMKRLENYKNYKLYPSDGIFDEIKSHINDPKNKFKCTDMGEFQTYMDKRKNIPAADAEPQPK